MPKNSDTRSTVVSKKNEVELLAETLTPEKCILDLFIKLDEAAIKLKKRVVLFINEPNQLISFEGGVDILKAILLASHKQKITTASPG